MSGLRIQLCRNDIHALELLQFAVGVDFPPVQQVLDDVAHFCLRFVILRFAHQREALGEETAAEYFVDHFVRTATHVGHQPDDLLLDDHVLGVAGHAQDVVGHLELGAQVLTPAVILVRYQVADQPQKGVSTLH